MSFSLFEGQNLSLRLKVLLGIMPGPKFVFGFGSKAENWLWYHFKGQKLSLNSFQRPKFVSEFVSKTGICLQVKANNISRTIFNLGNKPGDNFGNFGLGIDLGDNFQGKISCA